MKWLMVLVLLVLGLPAYAATCERMVEDFNAYANRYNTERAAKYRQLFGREVTATEDVRIPEECPKIMEYFRWSLSISRRADVLFKKIEEKCGKLHRNGQGEAPDGLAVGLQLWMNEYSRRCGLRFNLHGSVLDRHREQASSQPA